MSRIRALLLVLGFAWNADPWRSILAFAVFGVQALAQSLFAWWLKLIVDGVHAGDAYAVATGTGGIVVSVAGSAMLSYAGNRIQAVLRDRTTHLVHRRTLTLVARTPTLEIHETPGHLAQLDALRRESYVFSQVIPSLIETFALGIRIIATTLLLASIHPLLLLLPVFGLPALVVSPKTGGLFRVGNERAAEPARRANHLVELTATTGGAKEVRLFRLGEELLARFHASHREIRTIHHRIQLRAAYIGLAAQLGFLVGYAGALWFVVDLAADGRASLGEAALTAVLAGQVLGLVTGSAELLQYSWQNLVTASRYIHLQDVATEVRRRVNQAAVVPHQLVDGIRFENVSYRYPLGAGEALVDVNLSLPAGSTVAVVGDNGAGKTTLVKLLAGLYVPSGGRIVVDGVDLAQLDPERWRQRVSAGFQDHARFEFAVRETVGLGDLATLDNGAGVDETVRSALSRAVATDVLNALPAGLDTQLGPSWPGGVDLSGGQWQKLALARAMMRTRPLLLLLDEPTAALDADTEHQLFERWTAKARELRTSTGAITLLVSHRFSTVRMADLIIVLDSGRIVETGSHTELLARQGTYAQLFELQARSYR
ncbi:ABC transporter ATP-binding protein [Actinopolymorpha alba]|uniref:ABC transporter ATP-binding protein n=1 Tax=Actinopolymorpha alba TaxID=533267 RepID=UPI000685670B|nr:ABC transporter ATP-binding protein [Actinopolymorpha alba]